MTLRTVQLSNRQTHEGWHFKSFKATFCKTAFLLTQLSELPIAHIVVASNVANFRFLGEAEKTKKKNNEPENYVLEYVENVLNTVHFILEYATFIHNMY